MCMVIRDMCRHWTPLGFRRKRSAIEGNTILHWAIEIQAFGILLSLLFPLWLLIRWSRNVQDPTLRTLTLDNVL